MMIKLLGAASAGMLLTLSGCMTRGGTDGATTGGSSNAPASSQSNPTGSTATPSGRSPGQGAGNTGSATTDLPADQRDSQRPSMPR
jgi:hypothetical protein